MSSPSLASEKIPELNVYGSQREHASNPQQGHAPRDESAKSCAQTWVSLPIAQVGASGQTGLGVHSAAQGDIRSRVFLAFSRL